MKKISNLLLFFIFLTACQTDKKECRPDVDVSSIEVKLAITHLEDTIFSLKSKEEIYSFLKRFPLFSEHYLQMSQLPDDSMTVNDIYRLATDKFMDTLYQDTKRVFGNFTEIERSIEEAMKRVLHYYPDYKIPPIYTVVTGFSNDLFISDSLIVIGLDYFAHDTKYRPQLIPNYILYRFRPHYITPFLMMALSNKYNESDILDQTMLADMIKWGKTYYFVERMMPCVSDSIVLGYTAKQMDLVEKNEGMIWAYFVENNLLYETNFIEKRRYVEERPKVFEINEKCPGMVARWVGWQIVRKYAEKTKTPLQDLMKEKDAKKIFEQSGYKPKK
jgi:hypothetical protein